MRKFLLNGAVSRLRKTPRVIAALHCFNARLVRFFNGPETQPFAQRMYLSVSFDSSDFPVQL